jgi:hypothetical protein
MKKIIMILLLSSFLFSQEIVIGVVPQQSPLELSKTWLKIVEYLNNKTGLQKNLLKKMIWMKRVINISLKLTVFLKLFDT